MNINSKPIQFVVQIPQEIELSLWIKDLSLIKKLERPFDSEANQSDAKYQVCKLSPLNLVIDENEVGQI